MSLLEIAKSIEASHLGTALRDSRYGFPGLIFVHLCGLLVTVGTVAVWDLRLLGVGLRSTPVSRVAKALLPWTWTGFGVMALTGSLMVSMEAGRLYSNTAFRAKLVLLALAGINMLTFHSTIYRRVEEWDRNAVAPARARLAGAISLALWFGLLTAGRAIGYTINYADIEAAGARVERFALEPLSAFSEPDSFSVHSFTTTRAAATMRVSTTENGAAHPSTGAHVSGAGEQGPERGIIR